MNEYQKIIFFSLKNRTKQKKKYYEGVFLVGKVPVLGKE
jgi:hypothetical protein